MRLSSKGLSERASYKAIRADERARVLDEVEQRIEHYAFMTALSRVVAVDDVRRILREMREGK